MLVLIVLGLVLVGLAAAGMAGVRPLASERAPTRSGISGGAGAPFALLAGVAVVAVSVAVVGFDDDSDDAGRSAGPSTTSKPSDERPAAGTATTGAAGPRMSTTAADDAPGDEQVLRPERAALGPVVSLSAEQDAGETDAFPRPDPVVDGLEPNTVLRVRVTGFEAFAEARVEQCVGPRPLTCRNRAPVQFGDDGTAEFQYLVDDRISGVAGPARLGCRATGAPCSLVVTADEGSDHAEIVTVFHDELAAPGRVQVIPRSGLVDGQTLAVEVNDFPPGELLEVALCAAPDVGGSRRCGHPGPATTLRVGADGAGKTRFTVRSGPVGTEHAPCDRSHPCGVSVGAERVSTRAPVVPLTFARPPGARYDTARLGIGLAVAVLLLGATAWLIRRTDWSAVGEVAAPEIDEAEYADLDALVASLPPEPDLDELLDARS